MKKLFLSLMTLICISVSVFALSVSADYDEADPNWVDVTVTADESWSNAKWNTKTKELANLDGGYSIKASLTNAAWLNNFETITATKVVIPSAVTYNGTKYDTMSYIGSYILGKENSSVKEVIISEGIKGIGDNSKQDYRSPFSTAIALEKITFPSTVTSIAANAFSGCTSLTALEIPKQITFIGDSAFSGCTSLTSCTIRGDITIISGNLFKNCSLLQSFIIPPTVTEIGAYAFTGTGLTSITIPDSVETIGQSAFQNVKSLTDIIIPKNAVTLRNSIFYGCSALSSCRIDSPITKIPDSMFSDCSALKDFIIPKTVIEIGKSAFWKVGISSIELPEGLETIGESAFTWSGLSEITLPESVTNIGNQALRTASLKTVIFKSNIAPTIITPNTITTNLSSYNLYYPANSTGYDTMISQTRAKTIPYGVKINSVTPSDNGYTVSYIANDIFGTESPAYIIALYDVDNSLVGITFARASAENGEIDVNTISEPAAAKIFGWVSVETMLPLFGMHRTNI